MPATRKRSKSQHAKTAGKKKTAARKVSAPPHSSTGMRSADARSVPPTGIAKQRHGKK